VLRNPLATRSLAVSSRSCRGAVSSVRALLGCARPRERERERERSGRKGKGGRGGRERGGDIFTSLAEVSLGESSTPRGGVIIYSPLASATVSLSPFAPCLPLSLSLSFPPASLFLPPLLRMIARAQAKCPSRRASRLNGVCALVRPSVRPPVRTSVRTSVCPYVSTRCPPGSFRAREYVWVVSRPVYARLARMPFLLRLLLFAAFANSASPSVPPPRRRDQRGNCSAFSS